MKMNVKSILVPFALSTVLTLSMVSPCSATLVTFEDLSETGTGAFIPSGYQGLVWSNFVAVNAIIETANNGLSGIYYGMVTASNVAFNAFGDPAEIDSTGTNFSFLSAYLTGVFRSNLNVEVRGFRNGSLLYDQIAVVAATTPTPFTFNYLDIDRLTFNSSGGDNAGFGGIAGTFVLDNLTFEFVPEPSSFLLTAAATLMLWPILRRRRA